LANSYSWHTDSERNQHTIAGSKLAKDY